MIAYAQMFIYLKGKIMKILNMTSLKKCIYYMNVKMYFKGVEIFWNHYDYVNVEYYWNI